MTNKVISTGNWNEQKSRLKKEFPALTDKDLFFELGKKNEMLEKLQVKLGKTKEEMQQIIEPS
jgi:uncharacterized protein YjbJ (UPF0337 family)